MLNQIGKQNKTLALKVTEFPQESQLLRPIHRENKISQCPRRKTEKLQRCTQMGIPASRLNSYWNSAGEAQAETGRSHKRVSRRQEVLCSCRKHLRSNGLIRGRMQNAPHSEEMYITDQTAHLYLWEELGTLGLMDRGSISITSVRSAELNWWLVTQKWVTQVCPATYSREMHAKYK